MGVTENQCLGQRISRLGSHLHCTLKRVLLSREVPWDAQNNYLQQSDLWTKKSLCNFQVAPEELGSQATLTCLCQISFPAAKHLRKCKGKICFGAGSNS